MNTTSEVRIERLSPAEIEARLDDVSLVYVPLGALEFHGSHLPIGLDALTAHGICTTAAATSGGIVLPPIHHAIGGEHRDYPWTFMLDSPSALSEILLMLLHRLDRNRVRRAVLLSGHFAPEQRTLLDTVVTDWQARGSQGLEVIGRTIDQCDALPLQPDHAGAFETTLLNALEPDLVHLDRLPTPSGEPDLEHNVFGPQRHDPHHALWGIFGPDPRHADTTLAPDLLLALAQWAAGLGRGS